MSDEAYLWARQQNAHWKPPPPPEPPKPAGPVPSERDLKDKRDGIKCRLLGGPFDGKAVALEAYSYLDPVRRYAAPEIKESIPDTWFTYANYEWDSRQPDGVNIYKYSRNTSDGGY